jgi:hypothetical protein
MDEVNTNCVGSWAIAIVVSLAAGPLWIFLFFFGLWLAGFTAVGITAGSVAAVTQSGMPLVAAGSYFASLQSLVALGPLAVNPIGYIISSLISMTLTIVLFYYEGCHLSDCPCLE